MNLMDMIKGAVSQKVMGQMGSMLGTDEQRTSTAFENVAGGILGGLMKKAQTDEGAQEVFEMAEKQDESILDKLGDLIGGGREQEVAEQGGGLLDGIFGNEKQSMIGSIAKSLGIDEATISKLMMMVAPIIMGLLGRLKKSGAMDMFGLKGLLGSQGPNIANSLAPGLGDSLGFGNLMSSVSEQAQGVMDSASSVFGAAASSISGMSGDTMNTENDLTTPPVPAGNSGNNVLKIVLPILLVVGLILLAVFVVPNLMGAAQKKVTSDNAEEVFTELDGHLSGLTESLNAVSDVDSAKSLKSKFDDAAKFIGSLNLKGLDEKMASKIKGRMGNIRDLAAALKAAYDVEGARDVIRPMFDAMLKQIDKQLGRDKI